MLPALVPARVPAWETLLRLALQLLRRCKLLLPRLRLAMQLQRGAMGMAMATLLAHLVRKEAAETTTAAALVVVAAAAVAVPVPATVQCQVSCRSCPSKIVVIQGQLRLVALALALVAAMAAARPLRWHCRI